MILGKLKTVKQYSWIQVTYNYFDQSKKANCTIKI